MDHPSITIRLTKGSDAEGPIQAVSYCSQNYGELRRQCLQQRCLFSDPEFRPCSESLGYNLLGPGSTRIQEVVWKRPKDICKPKVPNFVCEGMTRTDVCQGQLDNCWFLAAAASLTMDPQLLKRVVPEKQTFDDADYAGIFHFRFWQYGQWVDVVVDDLLPTKNGELLFVHSTARDEFWMPLLEKAYAKLNSSYEAINLGYMNEAFVDFTGGIGETLLLKSPNPKLFQTIQAALRRRSLMGTLIKNGVSAEHIIQVLENSAPWKNNKKKISSYKDRDAVTADGLRKVHAYSITDARKLSVEGREVKLLRLRNPWGCQEWTGPWSDRSPLWSTVDPATREKLHVNLEDGEFWMQLVDFVKNFDVLEICHLSVDALEEEASPGHWNVHCFQGAWIKGHTAGGRQIYQPWDTFWMNPQFHVSLQEPDEASGKEPQKKDPVCTLLVSLMQKDRRKHRQKGKDFLLICVRILQASREYLQAKSTAERKKLLPGLNQAHSPFDGYARDITDYLRLPPGDYLIIPYTEHPMEEADFTLRVFTEKQQEFLEIDEEIRAEGQALQIMRPPSRQRDQELEKVFLIWAGPDKQVGTAELEGILNQIMSMKKFLVTDGFSKEQCQTIIQHLSGRKTGKLELHEFKHLCARMEEWEHIFLVYDLDRNGTMNSHEIRLALDAAGFHLNMMTMQAVMSKHFSSWFQVDFDDFVSLMVHLESVFGWCKSQDTNGDGVICMTEKQWMGLIASEE